MRRLVVSFFCSLALFCAAGEPVVQYWALSFATRDTSVSYSWSDTPLSRDDFVSRFAPGAEIFFDDGYVLYFEHPDYGFSNVSEWPDYVYHDARVVIPMLVRLKNCRDLVKLHSLNEVDLLDGTRFERLKWYFDNFPVENNSDNNANKSS